MAVSQDPAMRLVLLAFPPEGHVKTMDVPLVSVNMSLSGEPWSGEPGLESIKVEPYTTCIDVFRWSRAYVEYVDVPGGATAFLSLGDTTVSRVRHACIFWNPPTSQWILADRGSRNGTWVIRGDGQIRIRRTYPLGPGQHDLRIGGCKLVVFVEKILH